MYDTFSTNAGDLQTALNVTSSDHPTIEYLLTQAVRATPAGSRVSVLHCD